MLVVSLPLIFLGFWVVNCTKITDKRIIHGRLAKIGEFPYQVSIRRSYNDMHFCGGTIITPKHILTAAHCTFYAWGGELPPSVVSVFAGQIKLAVDSHSIFRNASAISVHPGYDENEMCNDIAVIELSEPLPFDKLISSLPLNSNFSLSEQNLTCIVSGWGVQKFNSLEVSKDLLATEVELMSHQACQEKYKKINVTLYPGMLCANDEKAGADACQGDSGGPLASDGRLIAVISTGSGCGDPELPGIYSNVAYFLPWILKTLNLEGEFSETTLSATSLNSTISDLGEETTRLSNHTYDKISNMSAFNKIEKYILMWDQLFTSVLSHFKRSVATNSSQRWSNTGFLIMSVLFSIKFIK